jgi:hypothetical protein
MLGSKEPSQQTDYPGGGGGGIVKSTSNMKEREN